MSSIPVAFVGGSLASAVGNSHRIAAHMDNRFELVAGCFSRDQGMNSRTAAEWGVQQERTYQDWRQLVDIESELGSVLVLLTPTPSHEPVLQYAVEKKMRIICEKSLTSSLESTRFLHELVETNRNDVLAVYNYTGYPMVREMRQLVGSGEIGDLLHCEVEMPQEGFLRRQADGSSIQPQEWRRSDSVIPTVSLDLGIHVLNLLRFVTGLSPRELVATYQSAGNVPNVVDQVSVLAECPGDVKADLRYGKTSLGKSNGLSITCYGSTGSASWVQADPEYLTVCDAFGDTNRIHRGSNICSIANQLRYNRFKAGHPSGFLEAFSNHYFDIANHLEGIDPANDYVFTTADALHDMKILQAISLSVSDRKWTVVDH